MSPLCCKSDAGRRETVRGAHLTGFDTVEVDETQTRLSVTFLGRAPDWIAKENLGVTGGRRERGIAVTDAWIERAEAEDLDDRMIVVVDRPGDHSTYRLEIVDRDERGRRTGKVPADFDPRYAGIDFSFKAACASDQDPADLPSCPQPAFAAPAISYLAKDYQTFRQLILDRMALTAPEWTERHVPDLGITLVELLAYVADDLSYYQDAVATEAFLETARLRESVRRHARLVDYRLDEGCSASGWARLTIEGAASIRLDGNDLAFATALSSGKPAVLPMAEAESLLSDSVMVFEAETSVGEIVVRSDHNVIAFYDWGEEECCIPQGATTATLRDPGTIPAPDPPQRQDYGKCDDEPAPLDVEKAIADGRWHKLALRPGDVLIFAELVGPRTGDAADADPGHRHPVRLTSVVHGWDPLTRQLVVEIVWCPEDALPFPLCLSTTTAPPDCRRIPDDEAPHVSVAWGNIVPVGHGRRVEQDLGAVGLVRIEEECPQPCAPAEVRIVPKRFRPPLRDGNLAFVSPPVAGPPAHGCGGCGAFAATRRGEPGGAPALPAVTLSSRQAADGPVRRWSARGDLLDSGPDDRHFVAETDDDGGVTLRFGQGVNGAEPDAGELFEAVYRVGSGTIGNIGRDTLAHILWRKESPGDTVLAVSNPLPMRGGRPPESIASAKLRAPFQYRQRLERAITGEDYAAIVMRDFGAVVQRAAASLRATGVRVEVQVAIDPRGRSEPDPALLDCIARHLERYRRIEHDVRVVPAGLVPIHLGLTVCVEPDRLREHVGRAVAEALGAGTTRTGALGFFHPDALSFGESLAVSRIVAAVHAVEGVAEVKIDVLNRLYEAPNDEDLAKGLLPIAPTEVARLDQDPDAPENGRLDLAMRGGR
jgi:hypothetical protein